MVSWTTSPHQMRLPTLLWLPVKSYLVAITMATDFVSLITETQGGSRSSLVVYKDRNNGYQYVKIFFTYPICGFAASQSVHVTNNLTDNLTHSCMIIDPPDSPSIRMFLPFLNCKFKPACEISRWKRNGKGRRESGEGEEEGGREAGKGKAGEGEEEGGREAEKGKAGKGKAGEGRQEAGEGGKKWGGRGKEGEEQLNTNRMGGWKTGNEPRHRWKTVFLAIPGFSF